MLLLRPAKGKRIQNGNLSKLLIGFLIAEQMTFSDAREYCQQRINGSSSLAVIESKDQDDILTIILLSEGKIQIK